MTGTCEFCSRPAVGHCQGDSPACEDEDHHPSLMCEKHSWLDPVSCVWRCPPCAEFYKEYDARERHIIARQEKLGASP